MTVKITLTSLNTMPSDLQIAKEFVFDPCGFHFKNWKANLESIEYAASSFELDGKIIQFRVSKITPTKTGQFVTIWKRTKEGITAPFESTDSLDFIIINSRSGDNFGQFIFPKSVLIEHGIITNNGKEGKRGIRVYPPWDIATNKQAVKTQSWQLRYFLTITKATSTDIALAKHLLT
ncbi:MepB family protein [Flavobacterium sp. GCM10023249]|uniref:MepB family protein n=1 Tax=unclassified Flavobacterium TaxID=196869 RepID=UPI003619A4C6